MNETSFASALTLWFAGEKRALPFRETRDPYLIWVSEIMAQQTRITALLPYFEKFTARFPTVKELAGATEQEVLALWAGLGYYSRARNLHKAAQCIRDKHDGVFPREFDSLRALPGVGDYTAGAIASIAYGLPCPAVDGNVLRVFARLTAYKSNVRKPEAKKAAHCFVASHMNSRNAGELTEALMELGALVCIPARPRCLACPVRDFCEAYRQGLTDSLPMLSPKDSKKIQPRRVLLLRDVGGAFLLRQRTERLLRGLWEFPSDEDTHDAGIIYTPVKSILRARHVFTHIVWEMEGILCEVPVQPLPNGWQAVRPEGFADVAFPSAMRAFLNAATQL